jgi:hypothetical protein
MFSKLISFFRPRAVEFISIPRDPYRITLREWRASKDMVKEAQIALANTTVRRMADVLRNNHIGSWAISMNTPIDQRAMHAARCEGYALALNDLESLATYDPYEKEVEADYGAPEVEELTQ